MKKILLILITAAFFSYSYSQTTATIRTIGVGNVAVFPNAAEITVLLEHTKPTLREAINENQATADKVLNIVKRYVSDSNQIKVSLITTDKSMEWNPKLHKEVFIGYESSQRIIFTLTDLNKMQELTEDLLKTRFRRMENITYFNTNGENYIKQAQEQAVNDAIETTKRIAKASHVETGKIISISTQSSPKDETYSREEEPVFNTFSKAMGGRGVTSSGNLIKYSVQIAMETEILH